jgi:hypothetical protein
VPRKLLRFDPEEWGGGPDAAVRWYEARDKSDEEGNPSLGFEIEGDWPDVPYDPYTEGSSWDCHPYRG